MKLNTKERDVTVGGVSEVKSFTMEMNAMAFHSVIDGIYADKISSPFRELCTNARDGHAANGNLDQPFDVYLPSVLSPVFKVRDYGIGLGHDDIMGMYSTMFASTKRDSNDAVGMIGLGSKSPFAYTSAFTVTSFFDDEKRVYSAFIGETGVPQIALMHVEASSEPNGMEVQFPVKLEDVKKFRDAAPRVLFGFHPYPNIKNEQYVRPNPIINYTGSCWNMYQDGTVPFTGLMARQGCVLYPIDPVPLGAAPQQPQTNRYVANKSSIYQWSIIIDFPIGELDVATSREALGYTTKTVANLKKRIDMVMTEAADLITADVAKAPNFIEACAMVCEARSGTDMAKRSLFNTLFPKMTYKGRPLLHTVNIPQKNEWANFTWFDPRYIAETWYGSYHPTLSFRPKQMMNLSENMVFFRNVKIYVEFEDTKFGPGRMRRVIEDIKAKPYPQILWLRPGSKEKLDIILEKMGNPEWINLETVEPKLALKEAVVKGVARFRYITTTSTYEYGNHAKYDFMAPHDKMYYIRQEGPQFFLGGPNDPPLTISEMTEWVRKATALNLLPVGMKVYFLNTGNIKVLDDVKMPTIGSLIFENVQKLGLAAFLHHSDASARNGRTRIAKKLLESGLPMPADLATYVGVAAKQTDVAAGDSNLQSLVRKFCPDQLEAALKQTDKLREDWTAMQAKYPLLTMAVDYPDKLSHYMELISK